MVIPSDYGNMLEVLITKYTINMENHKIQALKSHQDSLRADRDDVQRDIQQLIAEQEVIELQLTAVEKHLGNNSGGSITLTAKGVTDSPLPVKMTRSLSLKGMGFREAVRTIIRNSDRSLRPKEIADRMKRSDFEYTGKVKLYTRVGNELSNLKKAGEIRRNKGLYRLAQEGG